MKSLCLYEKTTDAFLTSCFKQAAFPVFVVATRAKLKQSRKELTVRFNILDLSKLSMNRHEHKVPLTANLSGQEFFHIIFAFPSVVLVLVIHMYDGFFNTRILSAKNRSNTRHKLIPVAPRIMGTVSSDYFG